MAPRSDATSGPPGGVPELELDIRMASPSKQRPKTDPVPEPALELAVDPRDLVQERSSGGGSGVDSTSHGTGLLAAAPPQDRFRRSELSPSQQNAVATLPDLAFDASLLADYGESPRHWLLSPLYAWRVFKRRRELKAALTGRREEAARAAGEAEDALVAFAERVRETAEKSAESAQAVRELRHAEELLRSRDRVLAAEQDAQNARLSQVDARLSTLEAELVLAVGEERATATELSLGQNAVAREDARLKRAESELRALRSGLGAGRKDDPGGASG